MIKNKSLILFDFVLLFIAFLLFVSWIFIEVLMFQFNKIDTSYFIVVSLLHYLTIIFLAVGLVSLLLTVFVCISKKDFIKRKLFFRSTIIFVFVASIFTSVYGFSNYISVYKEFENNVSEKYKDVLPFASLTNELLKDEKVYSNDYLYDEKRVLGDVTIWADTSSQGICYSPDANDNTSKDYEDLGVAYFSLKSKSKTMRGAFNTIASYKGTFEEKTYKGKKYFVETKKSSLDENTNITNFIIFGDDYKFIYECSETHFHLNDEDLLNDAFAILEKIESKSIQ